jgi:hypothetical protein
MYTSAPILVPFGPVLVKKRIVRHVTEI